ncbi:hypothetical protein GCM10010305_47630 [Streptomyces termitum]|uniref:Uncharacterized protein n=1 Tax=Streptomyces termitum TaxID=67368 RepID=A0A918WBT3_9ACTN|nr:hypothetical protein GCM10010305_47630 [Streptomyces termitum]
MANSHNQGDGRDRRGAVVALLTAVVASAPLAPSPVTTWVWGIAVVVVVVVVARGQRGRGLGPCSSAHGV